jgi:hypothetical protein
MRVLSKVVHVAFGIAMWGCGAGTSTEGVDSEVATSSVSGALNNTSGSQIGYEVPRSRPTMLARLADGLTPIRSAWAASWTCTGDSLSPMFAGPAQDPYTFTPVSCSVTWGNNKTASSKWSSTFTLDYGPSCDSIHPFIERQAGGCSLTRTTSSGGNTRTITGPDGNVYAVTHDTDGTGTGWDATVTPAPSNGGVVVTCTAGGCSSGATLVINGSHLTGTRTPSGGQPETVWDHTVSTGASGLSVTNSVAGHIVAGSVTVQHNLLKYTATTTFNNVHYDPVGCCFPMSGSVTTTFVSGPHAGKSETLSFGAACGEATLTTVGGQTIPYTLQHCI